jgi:hypothetical protein
MSKELEQFKRNYEDLVKYNTELVVNLSKSRLDLVLKVNSGSCNFSESPWTTLNNNTLAEFKALAIYDRISKKILPIVYPDVDFKPELGKIKIIPLNSFLHPHKITPTQLTQALDSIKEIAEEALQETISNTTNFEVILNFLESCVNFLIACVTIGYEQNFFKSSTFQLEQIKNLQQDMHTIFDKLNEEEKAIELDRPNFKLGNGFAMI